MNKIERKRERDELTDQSPRGNQRLSLQEDGGKAITSRCLTTAALLPENKQIAMSWPVNKLVKARHVKIYEISSIITNNAIGCRSPHYYLFLASTWMIAIWIVMFLICCVQQKYSVKGNDLMNNAKVWTEGFEENDYMSADLNHAEELFLTSNQTTINYCCLLIDKMHNLPIFFGSFPEFPCWKKENSGIKLKP